MPDKAGTTDAKASVQERILGAAEEIFANNSFPGTRISEIAIRAGVNQALIHYYFESKEKLYEAVLSRLFRQWETFVDALSWEGMDAPAFISTYVRAHFRLKCTVPNLYKIFHWETLEGGDLFTKYASSTWTQDFLDRSGMLRAWKQEGILNSEMNEQVLLYLLWGMMNQFYYRTPDNLRGILSRDGTVADLQEEVAEQMIQLTLHGVLSRDGSADPAHESQGGSGRQAVIVIRAVDEQGLPEGGEEADRLIEALRTKAGVELLLTEPGELEKGMAKEIGRRYLVFASTKVGEMPPWVAAWLSALERSGSAEEISVGIWVERSNSAADTLQRALEEAVNRTGAYAVSRIAGQAPHAYAKRYYRWFRAQKDE